MLVFSLHTERRVIRDRNTLCHKLFYYLDKRAPEMFILIKESYKEECFGGITIFRLNGNLIKGCLSAELATKCGRSESVVNDRNVNIV